jgi:hypothetical protein
MNVNCGMQSTLDFSYFLRNQRGKKPGTSRTAVFVSTSKYKMVCKEGEEERMMSNRKNEESANWLIALTTIGRL